MIVVVPFVLLTMVQLVSRVVLLVPSSQLTVLVPSGLSVTVHVVSMVVVRLVPSSQVMVFVPSSLAHSTTCIDGGSEARAIIAGDGLRAIVIGAHSTTCIDGCSKARAVVASDGLRVIVIVGHRATGVSCGGRRAAVWTFYGRRTIVILSNRAGCINRGKLNRYPAAVQRSCFVCVYVQRTDGIGSDFDGV